MKKSTSTLFSVLLLTLLSACGDKQYSLPGFGVSNKATVDKTLPSVQGVKIQTSLSQVALEWKPIHDRQIVGYRILRSDGAGSYRLIKVINDPYVAHYTDANKEQSTFNRYMISAFSRDGRISLPSAINVPKSTKALRPVPFVTAVSGLPNRVKVLWRIHPDIRIASYIVQKQSANSQQWESIATVNRRLSVEYIDKNVRPKTPYNYRVIAQTIEGINSPPSKVVSGSAKPIPEVITGLMATTNLPRKIDIIWKPSEIADFLYYNIYASDFKDGYYTRIGKTKDLHFTDKLARDGLARFYQITVMDKDGLESVHSQTTKGATLGRLQAPEITVARIINNTVEIHWSQTDPRTLSYVIYKKFWDGWKPQKIKITNFKDTIFVDKKIKPDITYTYYVVAMDKYGIPSSESRSVNFSVDSNTNKRSWF